MSTPAVAATPVSLAEEVARIRWFHSIDLGHGLVTNGVIDVARSLRQYQLPADLTGKTFLDVGAWDGAFSFAAERRGAKRVLATDWFIWKDMGWGSKQGFETARRALRSNVEDLTINVYDLSPEKLGKWDVVLFAGVLYHLQNPFLALQRVASVTSELLVLETAIDYRFCRRPAIAFYPNRELNDDPTNWCAPNLPALKAMLSSCGFKDIRIVHKTSLLGQLRSTVEWAVKKRVSPLATIQQGRVVVHARI
jgi:tRNA (mo5U34)-methyltransferase